MASRPTSSSRPGAEPGTFGPAAEPRPKATIGGVERELTPVVIDRAGLGRLLEVLARDRRLVGPTVVEGAVTMATIDGIDDLPEGIGDEQAPGHYRLIERGDDALFGYAVGPGSLRPEVDPPRTTLVRIRRRADEPYEVEPAEPTQGVTPTAWIGVRGCDQAALAISDRVRLGGAHPDPHHAARRTGPFTVAVDCGSPAGTCFCTSMGTGPQAAGPADLRLTELGVEPGGDHRFLCRVGTAAGARVLDEVPHRPATAADLTDAVAVTEDAAARIERRLDTDDLRDRLQISLEDPRWDQVADRCLSCTSCTLVCPTCFCSKVEVTTDLTGDEATHERVWDSCFSLEHSAMHGGVVRPTVRSRYRQWLTHKLDTWWDQFDTSGCVGCGRCIAWCPAGIDLTEEANAIGREASP